MRPKRHNGVRRVPFKGDDILGAMYRAWHEVIDEAEDGYFGDDDIGQMLGWIVSPDIASAFMHTVTTRVLSVEPSLYPDWRFAVVEVTGEWVDWEGRNHVFDGAEAQEGALV